LICRGCVTERGFSSESNLGNWLGESTAPCGLPREKIGGVSWEGLHLPRGRVEERGGGGFLTLDYNGESEGGLLECLVGGGKVLVKERLFSKMPQLFVRSFLRGGFLGG